MKKIWSTPNLIQCDLLKSILESEGIACMIQNEYPARFTGIGYPVPSGQALPFAWPELWVSEEDEEEATRLLQAFVEAEDTGETEQAPQDPACREDEISDDQTPLTTE